MTVIGKRSTNSQLDPAPQAFNGGRGDNPARGNWGSQMEFILSLIGYTIGFGNVWRFPYLCYRNGGGVFLIPYLLTLALAGTPLFFLEVAIGQYASLGPVGVWKMVPLFKGIGIAAVCVTGIMNIYYTTLITYTIFYLFASMTSELPWATCGNPWNTPACTIVVGEQVNETAANLTVSTDMIDVNGKTLTAMMSAFNDNLTAINTRMSLRPATPAEEFFERYVLELSPGIEQLGSFRWQLVLCNILAWVLGYLCLMKGIKSVGKVVYFTATFPYIVLLILLIRGLTLPGSLEGLKYYLVPDWSRIFEVKVWGDAAAQIFFSLGPALGGLIAFSSYNKFHNNCHRDAIIVSLTGCGTSIFAGSVIFSIIGFLAHDLNVGVGEVMKSGPGLAFVAYPAALARMPIAPFWSILFFLMLITAGLDSMFSQIEIVIVTFTDRFPNTLRRHKALFSLFVIFIYFLLGLPQFTQGGIYILTLIDWYVGLLSIMLIAFLECICIMYIYGYNNLAKDMEVMLGFKPNIYLRICWCGITPAIVLFVTVFNCVIHTPVKYNNYNYPPWSDSFGWVIAVTPLLTIPIYMVYHVISHFGSCQGITEAIKCPWSGEAFKAMTRPAPDWGPMLPQHRQEAGLELTDVQKSEIKIKESLVGVEAGVDKLPAIQV